MNRTTMDGQSKIAKRLLYHIFDCNGHCKDNPSAHKLHLENRKTVASIINTHVKNYNDLNKPLQKSRDSNLNSFYQNYLLQVKTDITPVKFRLDNLSKEIADLRRILEDVDNLYRSEMIAKQNDILHQYEYDADNAFIKCFNEMETELKEKYKEELK